MIETMPNDPILEAIFDLRFDCPNQAISSLLMGVFSGRKYKKRFTRSERLPVADFPLAIRQADPQIRFSPEFRLHGLTETLQIGSNMIGFSRQKPYPGWSTFKPQILEILSELKRLKEDFRITRVAFRYINLLEKTGSSGSDFDAINFEGTLGDFDLTKENTLLRLEVKDNDIDHTIHARSKAKVTSTLDGSITEGLILDIDTSTISSLEKFWDNMDALIEKVRSAERELFESLLKREAIERFRSHGKS